PLPVPACVMRDPSGHRIERTGFNPIDPLPPLAARRHDSRLAQDAQLLRNGRERNVEMTCQIPSRSFALCEEFDETAAGGVANHLECVHRSSIIFKRSLKCQ